MSAPSEHAIDATPHRASLRGKILLTVAGTSLLAILVASFALFAHQGFHQRSQFRKDMEALSRIVADYAVAPISFGDDNGMRDALAVLQSRPEIVQAELINLQGQVLHRFGNNQVAANVAEAGPELSHFVGW